MAFGRIFSSSALRLVIFLAARYARLLQWQSRQAFQLRRWAGQRMHREEIAAGDCAAAEFLSQCQPGL
jgi:hypothetical protein